MAERDTNANAGSKDLDPEQLTRLLELELIQKRAEWKNAGARRRGLRTASFVFLFLLIAASVIAFLFMSSVMQERRANQPPPTEANAPK